MHTDRVQVVGGGLAGCEAAWQLASRGVAVTIHEMRPARGTPAHRTEQLAELVCSNSFKSTEVANAHGLLKAEMRLLGSLILAAADEARIPSGSALAVDRDAFATSVTRSILAHPLIDVTRGEVETLPSPGIIATGPLTSDALARTLSQRVGTEALAFYDAIAPVIDVDSIDRDIVFLASRYDKETMPAGMNESAAHGDMPQVDVPQVDMPGVEVTGAYLNCPLSREEYETFIDTLCAADQYHGHDFDVVPYFEGCLPVEVMAARGRETLRFGPLKPVGLVDPRSGRRPYAVVQLRREDRAGRMWNLVGFQTRLRIPEQQRVFRSIPGLAGAEFLRYGSIHRNAYVNSPAVLTPHLSLRDDPLVLLAGQMTGVEGYTESAATGIMAGLSLAQLLAGTTPTPPPPTTMLGGLLRYLREADPQHFQPMNANFGLLDDLPVAVRDKGRKRALFAERALGTMAEWRDQHTAFADRRASATDVGHVSLADTRA